jgi:hypothetical protein
MYCSLIRSWSGSAGCGPSCVESLAFWCCSAIWAIPGGCWAGGGEVGLGGVAGVEGRGSGLGAGAQKQGDRQPTDACEGDQSIPEKGIKGLTAIDRDSGLDHGLHLFGLGPVQSGQGDDPSRRIDHRRDAHIDGPHQAPSAFDGAEAADRQVLFVLFGTVEPAVVGKVDEEIVRLARWGDAAADWEVLRRPNSRRATAQPVLQNGEPQARTYRRRPRRVRTFRLGPPNGTDPAGATHRHGTSTMSRLHKMKS